MKLNIEFLKWDHEIFWLIIIQLNIENILELV